MPKIYCTYYPITRHVFNIIMLKENLKKMCPGAYIFFVYLLYRSVGSVNMDLRLSIHLKFKQKNILMFVLSDKEL